MKRTTIMLPDDVDARLRLEARRRGLSIAQVAREAIERELPPPGDGRLSFFAVGDGSPRDASEHVDELVAGSVRRRRGREEGLIVDERPLLVPALVLTEVSYLLSDRIGPHAELAFARSLAGGELVVEPVLDSDWARIAELMEQSLDLPLGMVDASVIALAERRGLEVIATLDQRHFRAVRPRHVQAFTLVP